MSHELPSNISSLSWNLEVQDTAFLDQDPVDISQFGKHATYVLNARYFSDKPNPGFSYIGNTIYADLRRIDPSLLLVSEERLHNIVDYNFHGSRQALQVRRHVSNVMNPEE